MATPIDSSLTSKVVALNPSVRGRQVDRPGAVSDAVARGQVTQLPERAPAPRIAQAVRLTSAMGLQRDVLTDLRSRLQTGGGAGDAFVEKTLQSVRRVVEMTGFEGPVQWPDAPPKDPAPGEVLLPLRQSLADALDGQLYMPNVSAEEGAEPVAEVARIAGEVERGLERLGGVESRVLDAIDETVREAFGVPDRMTDAEMEQATREVRGLLAEDPASAVAVAANVSADDVAALVL